MTTSIPVIKFNGDELINFLWKVYAITRIKESLSGTPDFEDQADPMTDAAAQQELLQDWATEIMTLPKRADGTVIVEEEPFLIDMASL